MIQTVVLFSYRVPDNVSMEEAAYVEPLAFGLHSCILGDVTVGSKVLILGSGKYFSLT